MTVGAIAEKISKPQLQQILFRVENDGETRAKNVRFEGLITGDLAGFTAPEGSVCEHRKGSNTAFIVIDCDAIAGGQTKVLALSISVPPYAKDQAAKVADSVLAEAADFAQQMKAIAGVAQRLGCADAIVRIASATRSTKRSATSRGPTESSPTGPLDSSAAPIDHDSGVLLSASKSIIKEHSISAEDGRTTFTGFREVFLNSPVFAEPLPVDPTLIVGFTADSGNMRIELLVPNACTK